MKSILLSIILISLSEAMFAQYVYTIKADSVKITNCDSSELIIENHTQGIPGFLFNTGNGRTIFKKGLLKLNDSLYLIGADTLKVLPSNLLLTPITGWTTKGNAGTVDGINFLGTTDAVPLSFRVNNIAAGRIDTVGSTFLGYKAGIMNTGTRNTALGTQALQANTTGLNNVAIGSGTLKSNTTGSYNMAVGPLALQINTTGLRNTAMGEASLESNITGSNNTAYGVLTDYVYTSGNYNTAVGYAALSGNGSGADNNTAIGVFSLRQNTTGTFNVGLGYNAGSDNRDGSNNTCIGSGTGLGNVEGSNNTIIGANVTNLDFELTNNVILADGTGNIRLQFDNSGTAFINGNITGIASAPANTAGSGSGSGPSITIAGSNISGDITIVTGAGPAGGNATIATLTYANSFAFPTNSFPIITPANAVTAALTGPTMVFATGTTTTFSIVSGTTGLAASTTYKWHYSITGN